ncbi:CP family cyanate transporter-like MFS transporter [Paenibacillus turicensis]|uniref:CP family cyanate transporter-like MFS transporter n=1 Tax=Paenibacillus turicensis TaxID=160487 RepID=A0ABS4FX82_9BACL|nr:MFS transporter [Paenibacillus turicensis]MBP1907203.1 CP family cyanate transporter-like MFS transporter [Paenibacillus turicensis]
MNSNTLVKNSSSSPSTLNSTPSTKTLKTTILIITAILLTATTLRSPITGVGALMSNIQGDTGLSNTFAGLLTTLPLLSFSLFSLVAPSVSRKMGVEKTMLYCMLLMCVGIVLRSMPSILLLFIGTALIGVTIGICNVLVPGVIKRDFPLKVGLLTGIYTSSMNLWGAISSGITPFLAHQAWGWRGSLGVWVILAASAAMLWIAVVWGGKNTDNATRVNFNTKTNVKTDTSVKFQSMWKSALAWQITLFMGLQSLMFYVGIAWLPQIFYEKGISYQTSGLYLFYMQIACMLGSFSMPIIGGRFRSQTSLALFSASFFVIGYSGILFGSPSLTLLFMIALGLGCGTSFGLVILFFSLRTRTGEQAAQISGMAQSVGYFLAAIGPFLFGFLHDLTGGWNIPLIVITAFAVVTVLFGWLAGRERYI